MQLSRSEPARNGEALHSGDETERRALEGAEDVRVWDERSGDSGRVGRVSRSGIHLNINVTRVCGCDFWVGSRGLEDELGPGPMEDGSGCGGRSEVVSWWRDPLGRGAGT